MKEKKTLYEYEWNAKYSLDPDIQWFYQLFGWHHVKTTCNEESSHTAEKNYIVSDGNGRWSVEKGYEDLGSTYNVWHTFERETTDPKYIRYCELERKVCTCACIKYGLWDRFSYTDVDTEVKKMFSRGRPELYTQYKKRYKKFYVIGVVILCLLGFFSMILSASGAISASPPDDVLTLKGWALFFGGLSAICILRGFVGHMKTLNKKKLAERYRAYLVGCFTGRSDPGLCTIVKEALELQMEP